MPDEINDILLALDIILKKQSRYISINNRDVVFIGDTHGDYQATKKVVSRYFPKYTLVFLGDYVDRGKESWENINYLASLKLKYSDKIFLLMGNHEGWEVCKFSPADFWESLSGEQQFLFARTLINLPLAISIEDEIIALHGALPEVNNLEEINKIEPGSLPWHQIVWGDWVEKEGYFLGYDQFSGRPKFGEKYFQTLMRRFKKKILIRSHQPDAAQVMFNKKCLTIFTSSAYSYLRAQRNVAILPAGKEIETVEDLIIESI